MKLYYSHNLNPRVAVAVARHLNSPVEYIKASPRHPRYEAGFRAINPNGLVPVLVEDARVTSETDAIACRLAARARSGFWRTDDTQAEMIQWLSWSAHHMTQAAGTLYFERLIRPRFSEQPAPAVQIEEAVQEFTRCAALLDTHLETREWLLDGPLSYADFRVATALPFAEGAGLPLADFKHVRRWHAQLWALDAWRAPFEGLL